MSGTKESRREGFCRVGTLWQLEKLWTRPGNGGRETFRKEAQNKPDDHMREGEAKALRFPVHMGVPGAHSLSGS